MAIAICGLLALAQVFLFAHAAQVAHRSCALHGETIHVAAPSGSAAPMRPHPGTGASAVDDAGHEHEHCLCMGQARERFLPVAQAPDGLLVRAPASKPAVGWVACPAAPTPLWALAPKHSPPA